jgi:hypothetical protein
VIHGYVQLITRRLPPQQLRIEASTNETIISGKICLYSKLSRLTGDLVPYISQSSPRSQQSS